MANEREDLTVDQLKDELRKRELPVSGNKAELEARLAESDAQVTPLPDDVDDQVEARAEVAEAPVEERVDVTAEEDEEDAEVRDEALEHLLEQEREAREADPTVAALFAVEQAQAEAAEQEVELDESVRAMLWMQSGGNAQRADGHDEALEKGRELGAHADVQQILMQSGENEEQPLAQRPVELVDALEEGAGVGTFKDTSKSGDQPGVVIREQRRPGAPLTDEQADIATFPSGPKDRDAKEDDEAFEPEEGEGPFTLREDVEEVDA